jgi:hypothetical protein
VRSSRLVVFFLSTSKPFKILLTTNSVGISKFESLIKMKSFSSAVLGLILIILPLLACRVPNTSRSRTFQNGNYVGDVHGAKAFASVTFEPLREYTIMAGEIRSNNFYYTFTADIVGTSGYGDIVDHNENTRFRIKIDITQNGFTLTSNPLGPGTPTTYYFVRQ